MGGQMFVPGNLDDVLTAHPIAADRFSAAVPDGWQQGRGAFGGLVIGLMTRAVQDTMPDQPVRTITSELFDAVLPGPVEIAVEVLRVGGMSTVAARLEQGGKARAHLVANLGRPRRGLDLPAELRPVAPDWLDVPLLDAPIGQAPPFTRHFEFRITDGVPFGGGSLRAIGWIRPRVAARRRDAAYIAALADAWFPSLWVSLRAPRPTATVSFGLSILGEVGDEPLLHVGRTIASSDGYVTEIRELWDRAGRRVAVNPQVFAMLG